MDDRHGDHESDELAAGSTYIQRSCAKRTHNNVLMAGMVWAAAGRAGISGRGDKAGFRKQQRARREGIQCWLAVAACM
jgi:hypothetical protein